MGEIEKLDFTPVLVDSLLYSDKFSKVGWFVVDKLELVANNPVTSPEVVAVIYAHLKDDPSFEVRATSDKFYLNELI